MRLLKCEQLLEGRSDSSYGLSFDQSRRSTRSFLLDALQEPMRDKKCYSNGYQHHLFYLDLFVSFSEDGGKHLFVGKAISEGT